MALDDPPAGGQPPSDGMPSEPSEKAVDILLSALEWTDGWKDSPTHTKDLEIIREALRRAYAAERGVSAVPPTEEPTDG